MSLLLIFNQEGASLSLIVEDGSGKPDADAFVSLSVFQTYCTAKGYDLAAFDPELAQEPAIRRGTAYLSTAISWPGRRAHGREQSLAWPREGVEDAEGWAIPSDEVPVEVKQATCEAAFYELRTPNGLAPAVNLTQQVKSKQVGPMRKEFFAGPMTAQAARPVLTIIRDILAPLLAPTGRNPLVGMAVRR
jgi:hypothetical protein